MRMQACFTSMVRLKLDIVFLEDSCTECMKFKKCNFISKNLSNEYTHKRTQKCSGTKTLTILFIVVKN